MISYHCKRKADWLWTPLKINFTRVQCIYEIKYFQQIRFQYSGRLVLANELCCFYSSQTEKRAISYAGGKFYYLSEVLFLFRSPMGAPRVKMYCDEIVISDAIIRTVKWNYYITSKCLTVCLVLWFLHVSFQWKKLSLKKKSNLRLGSC